ncbi:hypothetical protein [Caulobacter endophyticus]|uniref:hypothetical protein n=1 Tax=Caulobacter endophyticus TaxID=2172652 RepID=UPI0011B201DC|nr:hypothetical protein [Caulobacter endophyticus]
MASALAGLLGSLTACVGPTFRYRFRLSVNVKIGEKYVTGSGVWERVARNVNAFPNGEMAHLNTLGDAIEIDLGGNVQLFVCRVGWSYDDERIFLNLKGWSPDKYFDRLTSIQGDLDAPGGGKRGALARLRSSSPITVEATDLPLIVRFIDPTDASSVQVIDPTKLQELIGVPIEFASATVEITRDKVNRYIQKRLPWLAKNGSAAYLSTTTRYPDRYVAQREDFTL